MLTPFNALVWLSVVNHDDAAQDVGQSAGRAQSQCRLEGLLSGFAIMPHETYDKSPERQCDGVVAAVGDRL